MEEYLGGQKGEGERGEAGMKRVRMRGHSSFPSCRPPITGLSSAG